MQAVYIPSIITNVACTEGTGSGTSQQGETPADSAKLYIFDANSRAKSDEGKYKSYMPYEDWLKCDNKHAFWTLSPKDYFVKGICPEADPTQLNNAHNIINFRRFDIGTARVRHWSIDGS